MYTFQNQIRQMYRFNYVLCSIYHSLYIYIVSVLSNDVIGGVEGGFDSLDSSGAVHSKHTQINIVMYGKSAC